MDTILETTWPALIGAFFAAIGLAIQNALSARSDIDASLREKRLEVYQPIWNLTGDIPEWPRNEELTYDDLRSMSERLKAWYFGEGGIYLSGAARRAYSPVQQTIHVLCKGGRTGLVSRRDYKWLRQKCSSFRTELTRDLQSRKRAFLSLK